MRGFWEWCYRSGETNVNRERQDPRMSDHSYMALKMIRHEVEEVMAQYKGRNVKVLDVGCGTKPHGDLMKRVKYTGVDQGDDREVDVRVNLEKKVDLKDSFDVVLCLDVLEHIQNTTVVMETLERHVARGGRLVISCPFMLWVHDDPKDFHRFTRQFFEEWKFKKLKVERIIESNTVGGWWFLVGNYLLALAPIPYGLKRVGWWIGNAMVEVSDRVVKGVEKILPERLKKYIWAAPVEYVCVYRA